MEKKIENYLHLYLGCEFIGKYKTWDNENYPQTLDANVLNTLIRYDYIKPILRPLSSMTDEEWVKCFELSRGVVDQHYADKMQRMATTEVMFTLGYGQYVFGFHTCFDNDVRIGNGICFYSKSFLIEDKLTVSEAGIETEKSGFNKEKIEQVQNINHIFLYLLSKHFDLFGLIDAGLALSTTDKSK